MKPLSPRFVFVVLFSVLSLGLAGCTSRCVTCEACPSGVQLESAEICEDDFNTEEDFDQAVQTAEGFGCSCSDS